jgi:hypothetical protein
MHRTTAASLLAAVALSLTPVMALGQDEGEWATYRTLVETPVGAFPSPFNVGITGLRAQTLEWRARYGMMTYAGEQHVYSFGLSVAAPVHDVALGFTAGYVRATCDSGGCGDHFMASASISESLVRIPLGRGDEGGTANVGFHGTLGYARNGATLVSAHAELPLSLVPTKRSLRLVPYVAPGVGLGWARDSTTDAGMLFTFGAGLGLVMARGISASVGLRRVFVPGRDNWLVGVDLAMGGGGGGGRR